MTIEKVTQVVDTNGRLKTTKCPKCGQEAMYFNFSGVLICRSCCYMPSCPTCKRHYLIEDIFVGEKNIEYMKKPDEYHDIKSALSYLVGQIAGVLGCDGSHTHPKSKDELVYDLDTFLKSYNDSHHLGISRYTDKEESGEDKEKRIQREIKWKNEKIEELKRNAEFHRDWHKQRIDDIKKEIEELKKKVGK